MIYKSVLMDKPLNSKFSDVAPPSEILSKPIGEVEKYAV